MEITTAIIPAGGLGTRMNPATKVIPKELLPIIKYPALDFIFKECFFSGITELFIVVSPKKEELKTYIESILIKKYNDALTIHYVIQHEMKGTANALLLCRDQIGNRNFAVLYPDEICFTSPYPMEKLQNAFIKKWGTVLGLTNVKRSQTSQYGIARIISKNNTLYGIDEIIEKPVIDPPSRLALRGRYIFTKDIWQYFDKIKQKNGEYYLTDVINGLIANQPCFGVLLKNGLYDIGTPQTYFDTIRQFGKMSGYYHT